MLKGICAISENNVMWDKWKIPRHKPWDLKRFKELTKDQIVVMWKWTYESLKNYRPKSDGYPHAKKNIIISSTLENNENNENIEVIPNIQSFLERYKDNLVWVLWWWKLFEGLLPYMDELYLTIVEWEYEWDVKFPENYKKYFKHTAIENWDDEGTRYETYYNFYSDHDWAVK